MSTPRRTVLPEQLDTWGHLVARIVCALCGRRELGHLRRDRTGTQHLMIPDLRFRWIHRTSPPGTPRRPDALMALPTADLARPVLLTCSRHGSRGEVTAAQVTQLAAAGTATHPRTLRL